MLWLKKASGTVYAQYIFPLRAQSPHQRGISLKTEVCTSLIFLFALPCTGEQQAFSLPKSSPWPLLKVDPSPDGLACLRMSFALPQIYGVINCKHIQGICVCYEWALLLLPSQTIGSFLLDILSDLVLKDSLFHLSTLVFHYCVGHSWVEKQQRNCDCSLNLSGMLNKPTIFFNLPSFTVFFSHQKQMLCTVHLEGLAQNNTIWTLQHGLNY